MPMPTAPEPPRTGWSEGFAAATQPSAWACLWGLGSSAEAEDVVRICARVTPRIERHAEALMLDLRGSERLLLGERMSAAAAADADVAETPEEAQWPTLAAALHGLLRHQLQTISSPSAINASAALRALRIGLGPTRTIAWLAATVEDPLKRMWRAIPPAGAEAFLAPLPLTRLCAVPDLAAWRPGRGQAHEERYRQGLEAVCEALAQAGIKRVEQLLRLPALAVEWRFGAVGAALAHIATGQDLLPFQALVPDAWLSVRLRMPTPLHAEQLSDALVPLADRLAQKLAERDITACVVVVVLSPESDPPRRALRHLQHPIAAASALLVQARQLLLRLVAPGSPPAGHQADAPNLPQRKHDIADDSTDFTVSTGFMESTSYTALLLRVGALGPAQPSQPVLWSGRGRAESLDATSPYRSRARLLAALYALQARTSWQGNAPLLRAVAHDPDAVLPEERYRLATWELP